MIQHTSLRDEYAAQASAGQASGEAESDARQVDAAALLASGGGVDVLSGGTGDGRLVWPSATR